MRTRRYKFFSEESSYDLSISDLMAAICCIFILVTISITSSLKDKNSLADRYRKLQQELYIDLSKEMGDDLQKWGASIDPDTLTIRFSSDKGFAPRDANLQESYKEVLKEFFPKLISILEKEKYKSEIEEIRIEGFTAPDSTDPFGEGSEHDYTDGIILSQERTKNVLLYCLENTDYSIETEAEKKDAEKEWIRTHIVSNGYSLSKPLNKQGILLSNGGEIDKAASRRVEFRIKTNSDKVLQKFQKKN